MIKSLFPAFAIGCLLLVGCSSDSDPDPGNGDSASDKPADSKADLEKWKSADGPARLAIIKEYYSPFKIIELEDRFRDKTAEELKDVFGEPDAVEKSTGLVKQETYLYYMGSTTKETPDKEQDVLKWIVDTHGEVFGVKIKLNRAKR